jgi:hypothetical protein
MRMYIITNMLQRGESKRGELKKLSLLLQKSA